MVDDPNAGRTLHRTPPAPVPAVPATSAESPTVQTELLPPRLGPPPLATPPLEPLSADAEAATLEAGTHGGGAPGTDAYVPPAGYHLGAVIGRGGMGEVVAANDRQIGREVAIKRMRAAEPTPEQVARFLREARVQARLDHPSIVPVHELGYDQHGKPYFTMKRITGTTMAEVLAKGGGSRQRMLHALAEVCLAVELAHSRGVVHRDLKPSNIMLGNYGEVFVLDWGVARVLADRADGLPPIDDVDTLEGKTQTGALLGTPGYMAPEQARGDDVGTPADVYALGSILFELLANEPLHPRGHAAITATLAAGPDGPAGPAARKGDDSVPPELDAACLAALATDPAKRPTARELAERIQRYLDGDRDMERRRAMARTEIEAAGAAITRAAAMRRAGRALALDPESKEAAEIVSTLMLSPPDELPEDLRRQLDEEERGLAAQRSRNGAFAFLTLFSVIVLTPWAGIKSWPLFALSFGLTLALAATSWIAYLRRRSQVGVTVLGSLALIISIERGVGPFMLVPVIACGIALSLTANAWFGKRLWAVVAWIASCTLIPVSLEVLGVLPRTWGVDHDMVWMRSQIYEFRGTFEAGTLIVANLICTIAVVVYARSITLARRRAQQRISVQAWHLAQLLPKSPGAWETRRSIGSR